MLLILLLVCAAANAAADDESGQLFSNGEAGVEPRQSFKIRVVPALAARNSTTSGQRASLSLLSRNDGSSSGSVVAKRRRSNKIAPIAIVPSQSFLAAAATSDNNNSNANKTRHLQKASASKKQRQQAAAHMITNATLKKLLRGQSLSGGGENQSQTGGKPQPNFKFLFIQRATAAPGAASSSTTAAAAAAATGSSKLAASVSKSLASSLMSTAAAALGQEPPLGASLSQLLAQASNGSSSTASAPPMTTTTTRPSADLNNAIDADVKRVSLAPQPVAAAVAAVKQRKPGAGVKRPSKVYNLPVKFVANGQPRPQVALGAIRQHLAQIKKLQHAAAEAHKPAQKTRANKTSHKVKKVQNSRLIYLPLKYLSNARTQRILSITKASPSHLVREKKSHRSTATPQASS